MQAIDAAFLDMPWYGSRQMVRHLRRQGVNIGRRRVRRILTLIVAQQGMPRQRKHSYWRHDRNPGLA
jgi:hypothetical protein